VKRTFRRHLKTAAAAFMAAASVGMTMFTASAQTPQPSADEQRKVTFAKDVAPIFQAKCQECHRTGAFAPMSLLTYDEARPWARSIKQKVAAREMPPWYLDRNVGITEFKDDYSLSEAQTATIIKWVDDGAVLGNPADLPPPRQFAALDRWHIPTPDLIVTLKNDIVVPAKGPDSWQQFDIDPGITEDRYIMAVETRPLKGQAAIHHVVTSQTIRSEDVEVFPGLLNEYAIGKYGDTFPEGSGRLIKAGTHFEPDVHIHSIGKETVANIEIGLKFYPKGYVPKYVMNSDRLGTTEVDLRPNTDNIRADGYFTLTKPTRITSFQPHMHSHGKAMCLEAIYPTPLSSNRTSSSVPNGGKVEMLNCVDRYQMAWHVNYIYQEDSAPLLPAGTTLHIIGWHNNTAANKWNPDPDNWIGWGQRTIDDMNHAWISWYFLYEDDFKKQVEERKAKGKTRTPGSTGVQVTVD